MSIPGPGNIDTKPYGRKASCCSDLRLFGGLARARARVRSHLHGKPREPRNQHRFEHCRKGGNPSKILFKKGPRDFIS